MTAILFGSIGTIVDTSELQRKSFNQAFAEHGLSWFWDQDEYRAMLSTSGGTSRISAYAQSCGEKVDSDRIHASKSKLFQKEMKSADFTSRPGVVETILRARNAGVKVGLITTTSYDNVALMIAAVTDVDLSDFDLVLSHADVVQPKPDSDVYSEAAKRLDLSPSKCVAIEDNVDGVTSAVTAGLVCIAFPNQNTQLHDFSDAAFTTNAVNFDASMELIKSD